MEVKDIGQSYKSADPYVFCTPLDRTRERASESSRIGQLFLAPTTLVTEPWNQLPQLFPDLYRVVRGFFLNSLLRDATASVCSNRPALCHTEVLRASPKVLFHNLFSGMTARIFFVKVPFEHSSPHPQHAGGRLSRVFTLVGGAESWVSVDVGRRRQASRASPQHERDSRCVPRFTMLQAHQPGGSHRH